MTTLVSLIKKDFQKVFPTIIGEGENKLSIDDLLNASDNFIYRELHQMKGDISPNEKAELISFLELIKNDSEYDSHIHYRLKRLSEQHPEHKSFRFFLYRYLLSTSFNNEDYSLENFTRLFERILEDGILIHSDFVTLSGFGDAIITLNTVSDELVTIFKDAVSTYPNKITLLWITAHLYRMQENYQEAIRFNKLFLVKLESLRNMDSKEEIDTDYIDADAEQMVCFQLADQYFDSGNFTEAMIFCNRILDLDQDKENSSFYYDTLIIRVRIHIASNDKSAFKKDYDDLLKIVSEEELKENYKDLLIYAEQLKY